MVGLPGEDKGSYSRTLGWLEANRDIISHLNTYNLAVYDESELGRQLGAINASDRDENSNVKSWFTDPSVHHAFQDALTDFGMEALSRGDMKKSELLEKMALNAYPQQAKSWRREVCSTCNENVPVTPVGRLLRHYKKEKTEECPNTKLSGDSSREPELTKTSMEHRLNSLHHRRPELHKETCPECGDDDPDIAVIGEPVYVCKECGKKWAVEDEYLEKV
jgi:hypothetical protein